MTGELITKKDLSMFGRKKRAVMDVFFYAVCGFNPYGGSIYPSGEEKIGFYL